MTRHSQSRHFYHDDHSYFWSAKANDFASGSNLLAPSAPDLCKSWNARFLIGGGFDGGTEIHFYAPDNPGDPDIGVDATPEVGSPPWGSTAGTGYLDDIAAFEYRIGDEIPHVQWAAHNLVEGDDED